MIFIIIIFKWNEATVLNLEMDMGMEMRKREKKIDSQMKNAIEDDNVSSLNRNNDVIHLKSTEYPWIHLFFPVFNS